MHPPILRGTLIRMVQATQHRHRVYRPPATPGLPRCRLGERLPEALVWSFPVEIGGVLAQHAPEAALAEDEQAIRALAPHAAQEAFADGVRPRRPKGRTQDRDPGRRCYPREGGPELPVVVANAVLRALAEGGGLPELLSGPGIGRVARHADVDDPPPGQFDDEEGEQRPEEGVRYRQGVAGQGRARRVAQEGHPGLAPWSGRARCPQVHLDGALGHADTKLAEFAPDPLDTPEGVLRRHLPDQGDGPGGEQQASRPRARLPPPERAEPGAMPAQQRLRLDEEQCLPSDAGPAGEEHQERPIRRCHGRPLDAPTQVDELLAQEGVLDEQRRSPTQQVSPRPHRLGRRRWRPEARGERVAHAGHEPQQSTTALAKLCTFSGAKCPTWEG